MNMSDLELRKAIRDKENVMKSLKTRKMETNKEEGTRLITNERELRILHPKG